MFKEIKNVNYNNIKYFNLIQLFFKPKKNQDESKVTEEVNVTHTENYYDDSLAADPEYNPHQSDEEGEDEEEENNELEEEDQKAGNSNNINKKNSDDKADISGKKNDPNTLKQESQEVIASTVNTKKTIDITEGGETIENNNVIKESDNDKTIHSKDKNKNNKNNNVEDNLDNNINDNKSVENKNNNDDNDKENELEFEESCFAKNYINAKGVKNDKVNYCHFIYQKGVDINIGEIKYNFFKCYKYERGAFKSKKIPYLLFFAEHYCYLLKDILIDVKKPLIRRITERFDLRKLFDIEQKEGKNNYIKFSLDFLINNNFLERKIHSIFFAKKEAENFNTTLIDLLKVIDSVYVNQLVPDDDDGGEEEEDEVNEEAEVDNEEEKENDDKEDKQYKSKKGHKKSLKKNYLKINKIVPDSTDRHLFYPIEALSKDQK